MPALEARLRSLLPDRGRPCALFVEVAIERMELWIRGVTPEPFGTKPTVLEREGEGWRLVSA